MLPFTSRAVSGAAISNLSPGLNPSHSSVSLRLSPSLSVSLSTRPSVSVRLRLCPPPSSVRLRLCPCPSLSSIALCSSPSLFSPSISLYVSVRLCCVSVFDRFPPLSVPVSSSPVSARLYLSVSEYCIFSPFLSTCVLYLRLRLITPVCARLVASCSLFVSVSFHLLMCGGLKTSEICVSLSGTWPDNLPTSMVIIVTPSLSPS